MAVLSIREIYDAARDAGFTPHQAVTWTAIAMAESSGRTGALNDRGEHSVGLWQINVAGDVRKNSWGDLTDPEVNARAAYEISRRGTDMRPWTTTHGRNQGTTRDYRHYLGKVEAEIGVKGDPRGVSGYGAPMLDPLPESAYADIDPGRPVSDVSPVSGADTDADGLTDAFEKLLGTDPKKADSDDDRVVDAVEVSLGLNPTRIDSDGDGLTDATEAGPGSGYAIDPGAPVGLPAAADTDGDGLTDAFEQLSRTTPTVADTDQDGLSDAVEAALGTDPRLADTDRDGVLDGSEVDHGSDPRGPGAALGTGPVSPVPAGVGAVPPTGGPEVSGPD